MQLQRHPRNPIITRQDVPDIPPLIRDPSSVFNPGAARFRGRIMLMLRVQTRGRRTYLFMAESGDGVNFEIHRTPVDIHGQIETEGNIFHVYDPRITRVDETYYVTVAVDTDSGCRLGVAKTGDFQAFEFLGLDPAPDIRNGVIFPDLFGGMFLRLDRPNIRDLPGGVTSGDEIILSQSTDLRSWEPLSAVIGGRPHYWDELLGPGPPPVKTREGWLQIYHGVARHIGGQIYQAGAFIMDLEDPSRVLARTRDNILEPREPYELVGQVPNVVFPTGIIVEKEDREGFAEMDSRVLVYYGAADTSVALATSTVGDLLRACHE